MTLVGEEEMEVEESWGEQAMVEGMAEEAL